jgi:hypothetical protein
MARSRGGLIGLRVLALVVGVVLIAVAAFVVSQRGKGEAGGCAPTRTVRGVIGSEKQAFFDDERVTDRLACLDFRVEVDASGSRDMVAALRRDSGYAFAFPSSTPTAERILHDFGRTESIALFSTPMVVATHKPIVDLLAHNGVVQKAADGSQVVDIKALLQLAAAGTTWDELKDNDTELRAHKAVLLSTTDPLDSNSAIMFLSIASQVANGGPIVTNQQQVDGVLPVLCDLIDAQGDKPETSQVLFDNYLLYGVFRTPMALVYESQYVTRAPKPDLPADAVKLFPRPTVYSRHTLVPLNADGQAVGKALRDDPELVRLAVEHGFRPEKPLPGTHLGDQPADVVESPSYDVVEAMLNDLSPNSGRCDR